MELARYIVLNPVRADMVKDVAKYGWSSYRSTVGLTKSPDWLTTEVMLAEFAKTRAVARRRYAEFVAAGKSAASPWALLKGQLLLGSDTFVAKMMRLAGGGDELKEVPRSQRKANRPALASVFAKSIRGDKVARDEAVRRAYGEYGYTMAEIGRAAGIHYSTVSRIVDGSR